MRLLTHRRLYYSKFNNVHLPQYCIPSIVQYTLKQSRNMPKNGYSSVLSEFEIFKLYSCEISKESSDKTSYTSFFHSIESSC